MPTRLNAYQITAEAFPEVLRKLEEHGQTAMGERQSVTLEVSVITSYSIHYTKLYDVMYGSPAAVPDTKYSFISYLKCCMS